MVSIKFDLVGTGWAEAIITYQNETYKIDASYLSDALKDLINAVNMILQGGNGVVFRWLEEPGIYNWHLTRSGDSVNIKIHFYEEVIDENLVEHFINPKLILEADCDLKEFASQVKQGMERILENIGESGYNEKWSEHPFPMEEYKELVRLLQVRN